MCPALPDTTPRYWDRHWIWTLLHTSEPGWAFIYLHFPLNIIFCFFLCNNNLHVCSCKHAHRDITLPKFYLSYKCTSLAKYSNPVTSIFMPDSWQIDSSYHFPACQQTHLNMWKSAWSVWRVPTKTQKQADDIGWIINVKMCVLDNKLKAVYSVCLSYTVWVPLSPTFLSIYTERMRQDSVWEGTEKKIKWGKHILIGLTIKKNTCKHADSYKNVYTCITFSALLVSTVPNTVFKFSMYVIVYMWHIM